MKKFSTILVFLLIGLVSCKQERIQETKNNSLKNEIENTSIHGELTKEQIDKYYPKLLDTITNLHIVGAEKLKMNINENITVSMLYNSSTFEEMILCTHDINHKLIDNYYVGKSTMFDDNHSHTINYEITNKNNIKFNHTDWGYINEEDIDTLNHYNYTLFIDNQGKIIKK